MGLADAKAVAEDRKDVRLSERFKAQYRNTGVRDDIGEPLSIVLAEPVRFPALRSGIWVYPTGSAVCGTSSKGVCASGFPARTSSSPSMNSVFPRSSCGAVVFNRKSLAVMKSMAHVPERLALRLERGRLARTRIPEQHICMHRPILGERLLQGAGGLRSGDGQFRDRSWLLSYSLSASASVPPARSGSHRGALRHLRQRGSDRRHSSPGIHPFPSCTSTSRRSLPRSLDNARPASQHEVHLGVAIPPIVDIDAWSRSVHQVRADGALQDASPEDAVVASVVKGHMSTRLSSATYSGRSASGSTPCS